MEEKVLWSYHDDLGHLGLNKTLERISRAYWFPFMRQKTQNQITSCLICITYSGSSGKPQGKLHDIFEKVDNDNNNNNNPRKRWANNCLYNNNNKFLAYNTYSENEIIPLT